MVFMPVEDDFGAVAPLKHFWPKTKFSRVDASYVNSRRIGVHACFCLIL